MDATQIKENVARVREMMAAAARQAGREPSAIRLVAACKTQPSEIVRLSAALDIDIFGENRMQEMRAHLQDGAYLGKPVHFIGHLQTNKVRQVVGQAAVIQSVGSIMLLDAVAKEAEKLQITQDILIEVNLGREEGKAGVDQGDLRQTLDHAAGKRSVHVLGLMAIPPVVSTADENRPYFSALRELADRAKRWKIENIAMDVLSMGMSDSFFPAILEGATHVRIGRDIFGARIT